MHPAYRPLFETLLGCTPYPGTLNLKLDEDSARAWRRVMAELGPCTVYTPRWSSLSQVSVVEALVYGMIPAVIVEPRATKHPPGVIELVACRRLWELVEGNPVYVIAGCRLLNCWRVWLHEVGRLIARWKEGRVTLREPHG